MSAYGTFAIPIYRIYNRALDERIETETYRPLSLNGLLKSVGQE
jgi:hypothetical protein